MCCSVSARGTLKGKAVFFLPLIVSVAFFLIADIDSPRGGLIILHPRNLESVSKSIQMGVHLPVNSPGPREGARLDP